MGFRILIICISVIFLEMFPPGTAAVPCVAASMEKHQKVDVEAIFTGDGPESQEQSVSDDLSSMGTAVSAAMLFVCLVITATCGRQLNRIIERKKAAISAVSRELDKTIDKAVRVNTREYERMLDELASLDAQEEQLVRQLEGMNSKGMES